MNLIVYNRGAPIVGPYAHTHMRIHMHTYSHIYIQTHIAIYKTTEIPDPRLTPGPPCGDRVSFLVRDGRKRDPMRDEVMCIRLWFSVPFVLTTSIVPV